MKLNKLVVGNKVKFRLENATPEPCFEEAIGVITNISKTKFCIAREHAYANGLYWVNKESVIALLEEVLTHKETPIEKPKKFQFNFMATSASRDLSSAYSYSRSYMTGFTEWDDGGKHFLNDNVCLPWSINFSPSSKYRVTVEEIID